MAAKLVRGNAAVTIGALYAGCDCFFGYPITPASEILHEASAYFPRVGRHFVQAESEEAAISMVYGAAAAGHRAMTASSGPGISLLQEGVSYLAGAELPAVIVDIMRAGPGLGNIGPEQSDYNQIVKGGGHGNYRTIALTPSSVQEMCDMTIEAFDLAFAWRTPVYVLADGVLGQMIEPLVFPQKAGAPSGEPPWSVAGTTETMGNVVTSIYLDFAELEEFNERLQRKYARIEAELEDVEALACDDAEIVVVSYGISSRIARSAVGQARREGLRAGLLRPRKVYPFPRRALQHLEAAGAKAFVSVEMSNGQMADDIRLAIGCRRPVSLVHRYGGSLVTLEQVLAGIRNAAGELKVNP
jgi:2-oxoisovalerate ferredoxin oxidoreductase alpha subunit